MVIEIRGDFGKSKALAVFAGDDVVADFPNLSVVVGKQSGFDFFALEIAIVVVVGVDERDFFADVFVEEFCGVKQIVFVILFEDVELGGIGERAEMDGGGIFCIGVVLTAGVGGRVGGDCGGGDGDDGGGDGEGAFAKFFGGRIGSE